MGVQFDTEKTRSMAKELSDRLGVSEAFIVEEALQTQMERLHMRPERDEGTRRAVIIAEQLRARVPPEQREEHERRRAEFMEHIRRIQSEVAALPVLDPRPIEEIMRDMYDEDGLPK